MNSTESNLHSSVESSAGIEFISLAKIIDQGVAELSYMTGRAAVGGTINPTAEVRAENIMTVLKGVAETLRNHAANM